LRPEVQDGFGLSEGATVMFELDLEDLLPLLSEQPMTYAPIARFPGAYRDVALVVGTDVSAADLEAIIRRHGLVEAVTVFDVYSGPGVSEGKRSIAFRIQFQSPRRTLTAEAVNAAMERVLLDMERETGAQLRG
jgi:phenylalanyl-tRNA synthetase beta chain